MDLNALNQVYHSEEGDKLAVEELLPVMLKYVQNELPKILEVGAGFGRNLFALSRIPGAEVTACDVSLGELEKAKKRLAGHGIGNINIVQQETGGALPFADNYFDAIVLWQVLEHVLPGRDKAPLLASVARVVKPGGIVLIETPNLLFPIDYHDTNLPLVHWLLPNFARRFLIENIRHDKNYPPSDYMALPRIKKLLAKGPQVKGVKLLSKIYFEDYYGAVLKKIEGGTRVRSKRIFFRLYYPVYLLLRLFGLPGDLFAPSLRLVFKIEK